MPYRVAVYILFLGAGIPWYWPTDDRSILFGLPVWVVAAIVAGLCAALFTAWCLLDDSRRESQ